MRKIVVSAIIATACLIGPAAASANHHACPQVTTSSGGNAEVARKDCSPVYVPYPVGGPKSPLPSGANQNTGLPLPAAQTPTPPNLSESIPGQQSPPDSLGCAGPDLSPIRKETLQPTLGTPTNSDPADPYNCAPYKQSASTKTSGPVKTQVSAGGSA